jgi:TPR repeat protein
MKIIIPRVSSAVPSFAFLLPLILGGCGERAAVNPADAAPAVHEKELTSEDYFAQLHKEAETGNAEAQFKLGWIYMHGEGYTGVIFMREVSKDIARAFDWYQKAAVQGHVDAQYNLGMLYRLGLGVKEDAGKAFMWLQQAAAQGNDIAQYNLGMMYAEGAGVKRNLSRACAWLALASAQGNEKAKKNYFEIDAKLTSAQRAEGQQLAASWKKGNVI